MAQDIKRVTLRWLDDQLFEGGEETGATMTVDGHNRAAPSPVIYLLMAVAGCTGADVASILKKMRVSLSDFRIDTVGTRREAEPRRYVSIHLVYHLRGEGLDEAKARRAIDLSIEKYCSVMHSLAPDLRVTYDLDLVA
ncbi:MAG TPA: OsmC family protein [Gemmatimonadales bacterium]|jgi:putative redox protein|nr:OsmC family protein [Gemmatimonadales bacterium]